MFHDSSKENFFYDNFLKNPDKNLSRISNILLKLGNPEANLENTIHIAGTNGKGSTLAFLKSCLIENSYSVNALISPHLMSLNERIIINNEIIDDVSLEKVMKKCLKILNNEKISFFEFITACSFELFSKNSSDWNLIEVGMGGSYDATNVLLKKDLSIITPISIDHEFYLGNTIQEIAKEKLGIINQQSIAVFGPQEDSLKELILECLDQKNSRGFFYKDDWDIKKINSQIIYEDKDNSLEIESIGLKGSHQIINAGMCIAALKTLEKNGKIKINDNQIKHGLKKTDWPGRLSLLSGKLNNIINKNCDIWLDGCHNPAASEVIADEIKNMDKERKKETILILGMSKDKNIGKFIDNFFDVSKEIIIIPLENKPSINLEEAVNAVNNLDYNISKQLSIIDALESLSDRDNLRVLICGSLYLVAETLSLN